MKLCVISDDSKNAASKRLLNKVLEFNLENVVIITPENATLWAERYLAQKSENGGISGVVVTNITRLFTKLYPSIKLCSNEMSCMLIKKALQQNSISAFGKAVKTFGFLQETNKILTVINESRIDLNTLKLNDNLLGKKLKELNIINQFIILL